MDKGKKKDLLEYIGSFLGVLFLALNSQFNFTIDMIWVEVVVWAVALGLALWGIWHNKYLFIDRPDDKH